MTTIVKRLFTPHENVPRRYWLGMITVQVALALLFWAFQPMKVIPKPLEVVNAFADLWSRFGLGEALMTSFKTTIEALAIGSLVSLVLAYLTVLPFFQPIVMFIAKMRFLGLVGLTFIFTLVMGGGHALKLSVMVFCLSVYFVASMMEVVASVTKEELDHARTLRMGKWRAVYEVIILGKMDQALEVLRQNAAITWMSLTLVEGLVRSEGGMGALLLIQSKYLKLPEIYAIQATILLVGLLLDYFLKWTKRVICPWSVLGLEAK